MNHIQKYIMPIKRELWEHQGAVIKMPLIVAALIMVLVIVSAFFGSHVGERFHYSASWSSHSQGDAHDQAGVRQFEYTDEVVGKQSAAAKPVKEVFEGGGKELGFVSRIPFIVFNGLMSIVVFMYLLSALYSDRKNSSILFWKSLPVSEMQNVLTKVCVAVLIVPAVAWLVALLVGVFLTLFAFVVAIFSGQEGAVTFVFREQAFISTAWAYVGVILASALWMLPLVSWLLLVSAYAKKSPFLYAVLPVVAVGVAEYVLLGSQGFIGVVKGYLLNTGPLLGQNMMYDPSWWSLWGVFSSLQFWLGCVFSAALLYGAIWLRENRFES